jgi:hypothetical protein
VDECANSSSPCDAHATCTNLPGSFSCKCNSGWEGTGFICTPIPVCGDGVCAKSESWAICAKDCPFDLVVVVESGLRTSLSASLDQYSKDLVADGYQAQIVSFSQGTLADLKSLLQTKASSGAKGAFLLGNLPTAWYKQVAFGTTEQFPMDLYLSCLSATFTSSTSSSVFDSHKPAAMTVDLFVSRLVGSAADLQAYFAKNHSYRTNGYLEDGSAYIFIDDSWAGYGMGDTAQLGALFSTVERVEDKTLTTRANYVSKLTGKGAAVVHQYIHSSPNYLQITGNGGGNVTTSNVEDLNIKGSFFNLFDCSASRYTETNLAMTYLLHTDYGLAVLGSTKTGGVAYPQVFDQVLASGLPWGEAYKTWYNTQGAHDDEWYLGIVILGDPMLMLRKSVGAHPQASPQASPVPSKMPERLYEIMRESARAVKVHDFADYQRSNPQFFPQ